MAGFFAPAPSAPGAPAPAPTTGFSFGGVAAPAPVATAPTGGSAPGAPSTGVGFGSAASAGGPAPAPSTGFGATPAPATTKNAPAPSTGGGFSFSGTTPASAPAASAPVTGGFGFGSGSTSAATDSVEIPDYNVAFPFLRIKSKISGLLPKISSTGDHLKGEELIHFLQCSQEDGVYGNILSNPQALKFTPRNDALRQKLQAKPQVMLHGKIASLSPPMMQEIGKLADDLHISEVDAMALYAEASIPQTRAWLEQCLDTSFVENALAPEPRIDPLILGNDALKAAKELYFYERGALMKTLLLLLQYRLEANTNDAILMATDALIQNNLVGNLITFIRESTKLANNLQNDLAQAKQSTHALGGMQPTASKKPKFAQVLLQFIVEERQAAAECLFYLTYNTQCSPTEVASLIDLVKELTNGTPETGSGLPILDPFKDVPDAYPKEQQQQQQFAGAPFTTSLPALREKDALTWGKELVKQTWQSGKPQLLQCVGVLLTSVLCTLDARHELVDRNRHGPNEFGVGNALYRPSDTSPSAVDQLMPIHERLNAYDEDAGKDWSRKDVWGLMAAAYAFLLRPQSSTLSSPRAGSRSPSSPRVGRIDVKRTSRACLKAPYKSKSFSFARLTLIPSFQRHKDAPDARCDLYEFLMSVTCDFVSHYTQVMAEARLLPLSRAKWEASENENLQLRREQQEEQQHFAAQFGTSFEKETIPAQVDLLQRPDCIDDIMAFVVDLCSAGSGYAKLFWSTKEDETGLHFFPSGLLQQLEQMQEQDESLIPAFASFLASLATAKRADTSLNGAVTVNQLLSQEPETSSKRPVVWKTILQTIRWYARKLSPVSYTAAKSSSQQETSRYVAGTAGAASTAYYYGAEDNGYEGTAGYNTTTSSGASESGNGKPMDLGDTNSAILLSHLAIITRVAYGSASARAALVSMALPLDDSDSSSMDEDPVLVVLFSLAISSLTPEIRGCVFATIASLLRVDGASDAEATTIKDMARKAWDLLELSNIVPVSLLSQYQIKVPTAQTVQGMSFPPASMSLAGTGSSNSMLLADPKLGIVFELEHVESRLGFYPSTEGLLQVLSALISSVGCPPGIGRSLDASQVGRPRPGCAPYIEYVVDFVLRKACESEVTAFRTPRDQIRLLALAMEVVEEVITRYSIPTMRSGSPIPQLQDDLKKQKEALGKATALFRMPSLAKKVILPPSENELEGYRQDFLVRTTVGQASRDARGSRVDSNVPGNTADELNFPPTKCPGFVVLSNILAMFSGGLFSAITFSICGYGGDKGIRAIAAWADYRDVVGWALFGSLPPTVASAKAKTQSTPISPQSLMKPLLPSSDPLSNTNDLTNNAVDWRELASVRALRILCAAAAREEAFIQATSGSVQIVPALSFKRKHAVIERRDFQLSRLKDRFVQSSPTEQQLLPSVTRFIGYSAVNSDNDSDLASSALALAVYSCENLSLQNSMHALCGHFVGSESLFAAAVSQRLRNSARLEADSGGHADIVRLIMELLRAPGISGVLLGLSRWLHQNFPTKSGMETVPNDCFSAILELVSGKGFVTDANTSSLAAQCYEVIYRLVAQKTNEARLCALYTARRLESVDFWRTTFVRFFAGRDHSFPALLESVAVAAPSKGSDDCLHSIAWYTKALSCHISSVFKAGDDGGAPQGLDRATELVTSLTHGCLLRMFKNAPLRASYRSPPPVILSMGDAIQLSMLPLKGSEGVVDGYRTIDPVRLQKQIELYAKPEDVAIIVTEALEWGCEWNATTRWECAASHLSASFAILLECSLQAPGSHLPLLQSSQLIESEQALALLDCILTRLVSESADKPGTTESSSKLLKACSLNMCVSVLLLMERLATVKADALRQCASHFSSLLAKATLSSMSPVSGNSSPYDVDERSLLLGSALVYVVLVEDDLDISPVLQEELLRITCQFAKTGCHQVGGIHETAPVHGQEAISMVSRSILSALVGAIGSSDHPDSFGQRLISVLSNSSTLKVLIAVLPTLDDNVYNVLQRMAALDDGAKNMVECGVLQALARAASNYAAREQREAEELQIGLRLPSDISFVPNFVSGHIGLLNSLLTSQGLSVKLHGQVCQGSVKLLCQYRYILERARKQFPRNVDIWTEFVKCLSLLRSPLGQEAGLALSADHKTVPIPLTLEEMVVSVAFELMENPFPARFMSVLPAGLAKTEDISSRAKVLTVETKPTKTWWDVVESAKEPAGTIVLPDPSVGPYFAGTFTASAEGDSHWSTYKYEASVAGAKILDVSLSFLCAQARIHSMDMLDGLAFARGFCTCINTTRAIHDRLQFHEKFGSGSTSIGESGMDIDEDRERTRKISAERKYLQELYPILSRCCEKVLVLAHRIALSLKQDDLGARLNLSSYSKVMLVALDHTRVETMGIGSGDFGATVAKSLRKQLNRKK